MEDKKQEPADKPAELSEAQTDEVSGGADIYIKIDDIKGESRDPRHH